MEEKERLRRLKDMKMKQVEQEAAKAEESRHKSKVSRMKTSANAHLNLISYVTRCRTRVL